MRKEQHRAEMLWVLKFVMSNFLYNSAGDITDFLEAVFPGSAIAQRVKCAPMKLSFCDELWNGFIPLTSILDRVESSIMLYAHF